MFPASVGNTLFTGATEHGRARDIWDLHPAVLHPPAMRKRSPICNWSEEETPATPLISWVKRRLIYPQAHPRRGLQTAHFNPQPLPHNNSQHLRYHPKAYCIFPPSPPRTSPSVSSHCMYTCDVSPQQAGRCGVCCPCLFYFPLPLPHIPLSHSSDHFKGPQRSKLALLSKWTGMGDVFS